jgi:hypothetical protein
MKVKMITRKDNNGMRIACRIEGGDEINLIERVLKSEKQMKKMLSKVGETNELGMYLYNEFVGMSDEFLKERFVSVPEELISEKNMKEIVDFVSEYLADLLNKAVDLPEVHETIAVVEPPEDVKEKLSKYGIDADFKIEFTINKEPGFTTLFVRRDEVKVQDDRLRKIISKSLQYNNLFNVEFESITGSDDDEIHLFTSDRKKEVMIFVDSYVDEGFEKIEKKIKRVVKEQVNNIKKNGSMNLLLAAIYNPLDYYTEQPIKIFDEPSDQELSEYVISDLKITRDTVFDYADIELQLSTPILKDIYGSKKCFIDFDVLGNNVETEIYLSSTVQRVDTFVREDLYTRVKRLEKGDLSIIKEVEDFDKVLIRTIQELIKNKIIECLVENNVVLKTADGYKLNDEFRIKRSSPNTSTDGSEIEVESDVLSVMPDKQREKLITFLVMNRLKNSVKGD